MYPLYQDLRERLGEPLWHDQNGVPRYAPFEPDLLGIYDTWACLFVVQCQACRRQFDCATGYDLTGDISWILRSSKEELEDGFALRDDANAMMERFMAWGDAPWHDDDNQCAGTTMTTYIVDIKELWHRSDREWQRVEISDGLMMKFCEFPDED